MNCRLDSLGIPFRSFEERTFRDPENLPVSGTELVTVAGVGEARTDAEVGFFKKGLISGIQPSWYPGPLSRQT